MTTPKPDTYNTIPPYFIVPGAQRLVGLLVKIFDTKELRRYDMPDGSIKLDFRLSKKKIKF